ncbi:DUF3726 domain-containing protein [Mesorhizobium sp. M7D.F.Ca.US.005.01.1.1]|uniref:DUF3726 domain-containing protein n=1 Tax=Mesorhizobium sp. M7D.F.Ca.US.005.01.1.1 TaxID=2493678 RepID=UPI0013DF91F9|nr:DUF3726 domain-containing protein [Mesorhizobium sp. M7D.F.Ca.US.005.01.1.1]
MIELSFNEVETLSAKAARGAGFSWGLAEDIGRAARALAADGQDWGSAMLSLVENARSFEAPDLIRAARWYEGKGEGEGGANIAAGKPLCPAKTAALLLDHPPPADAMPLTILDVGLPVWLDAMLRRSAMRLAHVPALSVSRADVVIEHRSGIGQPRAGSRRAVEQQTLVALNSFAAKTYVPESERSRVRGAGGGRVDDE